MIGEYNAIMCKGTLESNARCMLNENALMPMHLLFLIVTQYKRLNMMFEI
jgi:hypothetical protein